LSAFLMECTAAAAAAPPAQGAAAEACGGVAALVTKPSDASTQLPMGSPPPHAPSRPALPKDGLPGPADAAAAACPTPA
jgi:hypothetical protein